MAAALATLLALTRVYERPAALGMGWSVWDGEEIWPRTAHSPMFDFDATGAGAEWIDRLAADAKARLPTGGEAIVAHNDWSAKHMRFTGDRLSVVYDWDSLGLTTEARAVGIAAATFTANPERHGGVFMAPSLDEARAFVDAYEEVREAPLRPADRLAIAAAALYVIAYTARCEHARGIAGSFTEVLRRHGSDYLGI